MINCRTLEDSKEKWMQHIQTMGKNKQGNIDQEGKRELLNSEANIVNSFILKCFLVRRSVAQNNRYSKTNKD